MIDYYKVLLEIHNKFYISYLKITTISKGRVIQYFVTSCNDVHGMHFLMVFMKSKFKMNAMTSNNE